MSRSAGCTVLHVDMDAFFASVEVRRRPELAGTPVIVGGVGNRGVVTSATYEARRYGVHSAMPTARALRLCPTATVLPGDLALYSRGVPLGHGAVPVDHPAGRAAELDEAFLDVSGRGAPAGRRGGDRRVPPRPGLRRAGDHLLGRRRRHASSSPSSPPTRAKPDGLLVVRPAEVMDFLHPLPVGALWGVGPKTEESPAAARAAHRRRPGARAGEDPAAGAGRGRGRAPARAVLGPRPAPGGPERAGEVHRPRGDLRHRRRRPAR